MKLKWSYLIVAAFVLSLIGRCSDEAAPASEVSSTTSVTQTASPSPSTSATSEAAPGRRIWSECEYAMQNMAAVDRTLTSAGRTATLDDVMAALKEQGNTLLGISGMAVADNFQETADALYAASTAALATRVAISEGNEKTMRTAVEAFYLANELMLNYCSIGE